MGRKHADPLSSVAKDGAGKAGKTKKGKKEKFLGPATVVKPALFGAAALFVVQFAMHTFLKA